jgi:hypothetical protein
MDENGYVQNGVGIEMMNLNAIAIEKATEEIRSRER